VQWVSGRTGDEDQRWCRHGGHAAGPGKQRALGDVEELRGAVPRDIKIVADEPLRTIGTPSVAGDGDDRDRLEAGILLGLSREISTTLVVQTMLGTGKQLRDEKMHPVELRESVTSPGGTTIAAIRELEQAGVRAAFLNAIQAAMTRAQELSAGG
jgi:hypothetical protein